MQEGFRLLNERHFWGKGFNSVVKCYHKQNLGKCWKINEKEKKNIIKCWSGIFTPLQCQWALWKGISISTVSDPEYDCEE